VRVSRVPFGSASEQRLPRDLWLLEVRSYMRTTLRVVQLRVPVREAALVGRSLPSSTSKT